MGNDAGRKVLGWWGRRRGGCCQLESRQISAHEVNQVKPPQPWAGEGLHETTPEFPRGNWAWKELAAGVPWALRGAQPECGAATLSYLNSPLAIPPGDLVRSVAGEGDVLFPANALRCFLSGFGELEQMKY